MSPIVRRATLTVSGGECQRVQRVGARAAHVDVRPRSRDARDRRLPLVTLGFVIVVSAGAGGCGHAEDEWHAKALEVETLGAQLKGERELSKKLDDDLAAAERANSTNRERLQRAGVTR